jgi:hypothetical protein
MPDESELLAEELRGLAIELHRRHYSHVPQWKPSRTPRGLLSQIDNMTAGMAEWIDKLKAAISWIEPPFVAENTSEAELRRRVQFAVRDAQSVNQ